MAYIRVATAGVYVEYEEQFGGVTAAGAYVETSTPAGDITTAGAYIETGSPAGDITTAGAYIETEAGLLPISIRAAAVMAYIETLDSNIKAAALMAYIETLDSNIKVAALMAYVEVLMPPQTIYVTKTGLYVELEGDDSVRVSKTGLYVEHETPWVTDDRVSATSVVALLEFEGGDSVAATSIGSYVELEGGNDVLVTTLTGYVELSSADNVSATLASAYIELTPGDDVFATSVTAYVEQESGDSVSATSVTAYIEFEASADSVYATQVGAYIEISADEAVLQVSKVIAQLETEEDSYVASQFGTYVEYIGEGVYITKFIGLVEVEFVETLEMGTKFVRTPGKRHRLKRLPDAIEGYALDPERSFWGVIMPEATINYCTNPSWESEDEASSIITHSDFGVDDFEIWTAAPFASRGHRCVRITPTASGEGSIRFTWAATAGSWTFSCDVYGQPGQSFYLRIDDSGTPLASRFYKIEQPGWDRYEVTAVIMGADNYNVQLVFPDTNDGSYFFTDGWQIENKAYSTSFADGSMIAINDQPPVRSYFWEGEPNASRSFRKNTDPLAGRFYNFSDTYQWKTTGIVGLGMPGPEIDEITVGSARRTVHVTSYDKPRDFTITGRIYGCDYPTLLLIRQELENLLRADRTVKRDQFILRYRVTDEDGDPFGQALDIACVYKDGMAGNITNFFQESIGIQFHAADLYLKERFDSSTELNVNEEINANGVPIMRDENGSWSALGTDSNGYLWSTDFYRDLSVATAPLTPIVGGNFTQVGGDLADYIAKWDGTNWQQIGALNAYVGAMATTTHEHGVYIAGNFTTPNRLARLHSSGASWVQCGNGLDAAPIEGLVVGIDNWLYGTGYFHDTASGGVTLNHVFQYNPYNDTIYPFVSANPGVNNDCFDCAISKDNYLYIVGDFTADTAGTPMLGVARCDLNVVYTSRSFEALPNTNWTYARKIAIAQDGGIYVAGKPVGENWMIKRFNGLTWEQIGPWDGGGLTKWPFVLDFAPDGTGYVGGEDIDMEVPNIQKTVYTLSNIDSFGPVDWMIDPDVDSFPHSIGFHPNGSIITNFFYGSTCVTSGAVSTNVYNYGSARAWPMIRIVGPCELMCILNRTTGSEIWFNTTDTIALIAAEETLYIDLTTGRLRIYSDKRSTLPGIVYLANTQVGKFWLQPGNNYISLLIRNGSADTKAYIHWRDTHWSSDYAIS